MVLAFDFLGFRGGATNLGISQGGSLPESVWPRNVSPPHREPAVNSAIEARVGPSLSITKPSPFHSSAAGLLPCLLSARRDLCTRLQVALKAALPCCEAFAKPSLTHPTATTCRSLHQHIAHPPAKDRAMPASSTNRPTRCACAHPMRH
jgi:hypothetical protein